MASPSLQELAATISSAAAQVTRLLEAKGSPQPSLDEKSAVDVSKITTDAEDLLTAKNQLINAAQDVVRLAQGPLDQVITLGYTGVDAANFAVVVRFEIAQNVPFNSTVSLEDLATKTGLPLDVLARMVRYAITNGIFVEPSPGQIGHSAASATLAKNKGVHDMAVFNTGLTTKIVVSLADTLKAQQADPKTAPKAAFNDAFPGYENLFDFMGKSQEQSQNYFSYLDGRSQLPRYSTDNLTVAWDWAKVGSGTIIDVGGSSGHTLFALAPHCPGARLVVQDINAEGFNMGKEYVAKHPELESRVEFIQHDFFQPQEIAADVFIFRHILHDWSDADCVRILKALVPALKAGAKILVSEGIVAEPPTRRSGLLEDRHVRIDDQVMLAAHNAQERSVEQFSRIFKEAGEDFELVGVTGGQPGIHHSLVEYVYGKK